MTHYLISGETEMFELGKRWGSQINPGTVLAFFGELGAGKTTFTKGIVASFCEIDPLNVQSPTFNYLNIYEGKQTVYHFDLYRLTRAEEFFNMGFDEYFNAGGVCCIEWSERIEQFLPKESVRIYFEHVTEEKRRVVVDDSKSSFH